MGKNISLIVPEGRLPELQDAQRRIGWGERIEQSQTVRIRKGGQPIEVSLSISPIKSASGATIGFSKVARDITEPTGPGRCCGSRPKSFAASSRPRRI